MEGEAILTSLRHVDGGVEVRLFNPTHETIQPILRLRDQLPLQRVQPVDFESRPCAEPQSFQDGTYVFTLAPKQITTLRFAQNHSKENRAI